MKASPYQIYRRLVSNQRDVHCQFEDAEGNRCEELAIASHTVQRSRALRDLAQDGHVLHIDFNGFRSESEGQVRFERIGVRKASVFPGFCSTHDHDLFKDVESGAGTLSERERSLVSYRSICHELYKKELLISAFSNLELRRAAEMNGSLYFIDAHLEGCRRARSDLLRSKATHLAFLNKGQGNFKSVLFVIDGALPFAFSTAFAPEYDLHGEDILPPEQKEWGSVSCVSGQLKGSSVLMFCGFDDVKHHLVSQFLASLSILSTMRVGGFAFHIGIEFAENLFFKPSWVNSLLPEIKDQLVKRFQIDVPGQQSQTKKEIAHQFDIVHLRGKMQQA
jgi:hypothetical protein